MSEAPRWTALLLAGERPGGDPMARTAGVTLKALLPVAGEAMVLRPIRALLASSLVSGVRVLTQYPDRLAPVLPDNVSVELSSTTIASTLAAICADPVTRFPLLVTTADHALLDRQVVDEFLAAAQDVDVAVGFVERRQLIARFPHAQRTWLKFRGGAYSGANLFALTGPRAALALERWRAVEQDRKKGWRVVAQLGVPLLLGAVLRLRTLDQTAEGLGRRLGIRIRAVQLSNPIAAIDVDKPSDLVLVEAILAGRA